ncbi:recombinase family protein [Tyzzerella sp. OttesenSCG-928-J15]|nr:recombinase family protein [Tyzzerella sp. OttesenSCG-928-J15]
MARTSKGNTIVQDNFTQPMLYKTAIYARLSVEDTRADSNSIESQIRLCESFVNSKTNMKLVKIFDDNGFTGMNFNRPSFIKLMEMVKSGEINCVVVKDLSRLGRHYIEVVDYVEQVFPSLNVRFISVNDTVDTFAPDFNKDILMIAVKSLVNDAYARDISAKIKSTIGILRKKGYFLGSVPPYGYADVIIGTNPGKP